MDAYEREQIENPKEKSIELTPLGVQEIIYECIINHLLMNDPTKDGFAFEDKYSLDKKKSKIYVAIANHYDEQEVEKRPAIIVYRESDSILRPTINQMLKVDAKESKTSTFAIHNLTCGIAVITQPFGYAESLAEYIRKFFTQYEERIRKDFCLRRFRLRSISAPQLFMESKPNYIIVLSIEVSFDESTIIFGDDLKMKVKMLFNTL